MKRLLRSLQFTSLLLGLTILIVNNPSEYKYLERIAVDYGKMHHGVPIKIESLMEMGSTKRTSYLFYSTYQYRYQNISVEYWGVAGLVFHSATHIEELTPTFST